MKNTQEELHKLQDKMIKDQNLPLKTNLVFGEGAIDSPIMLIGEAPGLNEDLEKRPFVGRSGKLLTATLEELGIPRSSVYITNIVKRRPPENRDPLPEEIAAYTPYLKEQIKIINPKIIVTLGRFSMNYFLPTAKITRDQGKIFRLDGRLIIPMFHPAAALRSTGTLDAFKKSFKKLPKILNQYDSLIKQPL
jgi:DNA polymerase